MKKLILHIGTHKTGSTSIQHALISNQKHLSAKGISVFNKDTKGNNIESGNLSCWIKCSFDDMQSGYGGKILLPDKFSEELSKSGNNVVASSESFSWLFNPVEIIKLKNALRQNFDEIKILIYLRRQDELAVSFYTQSSKDKNATARHFFGDSLKAIPEYNQKHDLYYDYHSKLKPWIDAFGLENLVVRIFERKKMKDGDVVIDFFNYLNIKDYKKISNKNESIGFVKHRMGQLINQKVENPYLEKIFRKEFNIKGRKALPCRSEALLLYSKYELSNQKLNRDLVQTENFNLFSNDFNKYPIDSIDNWSEDEANDSIALLLGTIDKIGFICLAKYRLKYLIRRLFN